MTPGAAPGTVVAIPADLLAPPSVRPRYRFVALLAAVVLTAGAGIVHLSVVPEHLQEYLPFGIFFILTGLAQLAGAVAIAVR
ncbi:MAG: hypothetical protein ACRDQH_03430, partial [Pseudonocardiaceae bacterium]